MLNKTLAAVVLLPVLAAVAGAADAPQPGGPPAPGPVASDWPCFRGPAHNGVSPDAAPPLSWAADRNVRWKVPLPRPGNSSPAVSKDRVFVTSALDEKGRERALLCFDRATGRELWRRAVTYLKTDPTHGTNPYCSSSPAADGTRVVAWHGSAGLFCYDYDGNPLWSRTDLGETRHGLGYGSSPVFHAGSVLLNFGPGAATAVYAFDRADGRTLWRTPEAVEVSDWVGSWATPVVARVGGRDQVVVPMPLRVNAYDPATGAVLWSVRGLSKLVYTDVLLAPDGSAGIAMSGYNGPAVGFRLGGAGDVTDANRAWAEPRNPQRIASGVWAVGHVYLPNENVIQCLDAATGKEVWKHRPPGATFWGPAVSAAGRVYAAAQDGTTYVFAPDPAGFVLLSANPLGERTNGSPAVAGSQVFIRGFEHLYCIGAE